MTLDEQQKRQLESTVFAIEKLMILTIAFEFARGNAERSRNLQEMIFGMMQDIDPQNRGIGQADALEIREGSQAIVDHVFLHAERLAVQMRAAR